jgi:hypothetical protein
VRKQLSCRSCESIVVYVNYSTQYQQGEHISDRTSDSHIYMHNMYPFGAYATGMNPFAQAQRELRHLLHPATSKRRRTTSDGQWAPKRAGFGDEKWCSLAISGERWEENPKTPLFDMILKLSWRLILGGWNRKDIRYRWCWMIFLSGFSHRTTTAKSYGPKTQNIAW